MHRISLAVLIQVKCLPSIVVQFSRFFNCESKGRSAVRSRRIVSGWKQGELYELPLKIESCVWVMLPVKLPDDCFGF